MTEKFRVRHSLSSLYHPQSNGLVERFNRTLCEGIAKVAEEITDWDQYIQPVLLAYRIKPLRISKYSPYQVVYGKEPQLAVDKPSKGQSYIERLLDIIERVPQLRNEAKKSIKEAQEKLEKAFGNHQATQFQKGELV